MDLSIIIVNWNVRDLLRKCIESIFRETKDISFEIFIVDNNSFDGSGATLQELASIYGNSLHVILNKENAGFSKANNQALGQASGEFILFLNPDTEIQNRALETMIRYMRTQPDVAASTCTLINQDGTIQRNVKRHPTFLSQFLIMLKLHHMSPWCQTMEHYLAKDFDYSKEQQVEQIMGAFFLTYRKHMEALGGWDEDYWLWWEDVQLCTDFAKRKWKIMYTPIAKVLHYEGKSFAQWMHLRRQQKFNRGMLIYFRKNGTLWQVSLLHLLHLPSLLLAFLAQIAQIQPKTQSKV